MSYLTLKGINKIYPNGYHAVHDFNLEIEKGEFIVFVGSSGCGKSTTLRMIAGLENISKGDFLIDGARANEKGPRERGVAMVFQSYALYPHMSVYENLAFGLTLQGVDEDVIEQKVYKTAKILGLTDYLDRKPRELSGGAKQRVTMRSEITQIHRETGATTIYVTHDQTEAMTMADRIVVMKEGYVQQVGTPYDLYFNPVNMFVAGFIGEPPMNFITATVKGGRLDIKGNIIDLGAVADKSVIDRYENKEVALGFRPEAIRLAEGSDSGDAYRIACTVELTELLGDNTNVYADIQGIKTILKVDPQETPQLDARLDFLIPYKNVYLFDKDTEKRIKLRVQ